MERQIIAMWSGPRNISTAMMRSWGNRADTVVIDEPFYGHYLEQTGYDHPDAGKVIAAHETDWCTIVTRLTGEIPDNKSIYYQKHMTHHMLDHIDKTWLKQVTNCFLIRDPRRMLLSLIKVLPEPTIEQTGVPQQLDIFNYVCDVTGEIPPVLAAEDILINPREMLTKLCDALNVPFDEAMLKWDAGRRETDGVWADHWYSSVEKSTGFMPYKEDNSPVPDQFRPLLDECQVLYDQIAKYCIR